MCRLWTPCADCGPVHGRTQIRRESNCHQRRRGRGMSSHRPHGDSSFRATTTLTTYRVLHGNAPRYLGPLTSTVDVPGRRALRSAGTNRLVVPPVRLATVGSRAFPVAAAHTWNSLPEDIVSASTLQSFKRHLKTFPLQQSFRLAL